MARLACAIDLDASVPAAWQVLTDWERQGEWMPFTRVRAAAGGGVGVGGGVAAWTGLGRCGFLDTMTITRWEPPVRCEVRHTGRVIRGVALFELTELPGGRSRLSWSESIEPPFGRVGRLGWWLALPSARRLLELVLRRFARQLRARSHA